MRRHAVLHATSVKIGTFFSQGKIQREGITQPNLLADCGMANRDGRGEQNETAMII